MIRYSLKTLEKDGIITFSSQCMIVTDRVHKLLGKLELKLNEMATIV
jgi:predicted transcriptional regulator